MKEALKFYGLAVGCTVTSFMGNLALYNAIYRGPINSAIEQCYSKTPDDALLSQQECYSNVIDIYEDAGVPFIASGILCAFILTRYFDPKRADNA